MTPSQLRDTRVLFPTTFFTPSDDALQSHPHLTAGLPRRRWRFAPVHFTGVHAATATDAQHTAPDLSPI
jgi:hypothetical protein